jgi:CHAD domain-containing protein
VLEVERKYEAGEGFAVPDLATIPGVARVTDPEEQALTATYFDTTDHRLSGFGITLRRRVGGSDDGWHLKLPSAVEEGERHELQIAAGRAVRTVPKRFRTTVAALTGDQELVPVAEVTNHRTLRRLLDDDDRVLAEVVDDRVEAGPLPATEGADVAWREIEVELVEGDDSLLDRVGTTLGEAGATPSQRRSKVGQVLGEPGDVEPLAPTRPRDPVAQLVQHRLAEQLHELLLRDPLARENLPEGVHKMRVATRRLRSALATARPFLDRSVTEPVRDELSWLSDVLGTARDAEMQGARLERAVDDLVEERRVLDWEPRRVRPALLGPLRERHERAVAELRDVLLGSRYAAFLDLLRTLVADPPWTEESTATVRDTYLARLEHELGRVESRIEAALAETDPEARGVGLHEARKAAKRARYAVEPLRPVYGAPAAKLVKRLKKLQSRLGQRQDTVVTREYLLALIRSADARDPAAALVAGALIEREARDAERYEAKAVKKWQKVTAASHNLLS